MKHSFAPNVMNRPEMSGHARPKHPCPKSKKNLVSVLESASDTDSDTNSCPKSCPIVSEIGLKNPTMTGFSSTKRPLIPLKIGKCS